MRAKRFISIILSILIVCSSFAGLTVFADENNNHTYTVVGDAAFLSGKWDPTDIADDLSLQYDGTYKITYVNVAKSDCYTVKVAEDHAWYNSFGAELGDESDIEFSVTEDNSTVEIILTLQGTKEKEIDGVLTTLNDGYVTVLVNGEIAPDKVILDDSGYDTRGTTVNVVDCNIGDIITYTYYLKTPGKFEDFQGSFNYSSGLKIRNLKFADNKGVMSDISKTSIAYYNGTSFMDPYDFTESRAFFSAEFEVIGDGEQTIKNNMYIISGIDGTDYYSYGVINGCEEKFETKVVNAPTTYGGGIYLPKNDVKTNRYFLKLPVDERDSYGNVHNWMTFSNATATCFWWEGTDACESWQKSYRMKKTDLDNIFYIDVPDNVHTVIFSNGIYGGEAPAEGEIASPSFGKNCQTVNVCTEYYEPKDNPNYPQGTASFDNMIYVVDVNNVSYNEHSKAPTYGGEWRYLHSNGSIDYTSGTIYKPKEISVTTDKSELTLKTDTSAFVKTTVKGGDYGYTTDWKSDNPDVAEVDETGKITAKNKGTATITVRVQNPGNETDVAQAEIIVNVVDLLDGKVTGETGDCTWTYDDTSGTMTISGTGNMDSYSEEDQPWYGFKSLIKHLIIGDGITSVGKYTFNDCINLTSVTISNSVTSIGYSAFENCTNLEDVYYIGTSDEWNMIYIKSYNDCLQYANLCFVDVAKPIAKITSTKDVDNKQTVTLTLNDDTGVLGYYWGESSDYQKNPFTETSKESVIKTIINPGTYYLTVKDINGNVSDTVSVTFYKISLEVNGGDISPTYILVSSGNSIDLPVPIKNGYIFMGWAKENSDTGYFFETITPIADTTYYAIWQSTGVEKQDQSIDCASSAYAKTYGAKPFSLNAKAETALSYVSSNPKVAYVSADGTVTIKGAGKATITITAEEAGNYTSATATVKITVSKATQRVTGVKTQYVTSAGKSFILKPKAKTKLTYTSSNKNVAVVSSTGKVTVKAGGYAYITVKASENGNYKSAYVKTKIISAPRDFTSKDISKVKKTGKTTAKITWKSLAGATGYTVQLATNKSYKGAKTVKNSKNTANFTNLKKGKTYYVRINAYTKVSGKNYSNKWYTVKFKM